MLSLFFTDFNCKSSFPFKLLFCLRSKQVIFVEAGVTNYFQNEESSDGDQTISDRLTSFISQVLRVSIF